MANQNSVAGIYNYPVTLSQYTAGTELALLAPLATGVYPSLPSPSVPLSTSAYPVVLWQGVPPDVAGGEFDGHPFQVEPDDVLARALAMSRPVLEEASRQLGLPADFLRRLSRHPDLVASIEQELTARDGSP